MKVRGKTSYSMHVRASSIMQTSDKVYWLAIFRDSIMFVIVMGMINSNRTVLLGMDV